MATISVQTKKFADLEAILSVTGTEQMLIHDGNGVKVITVENLHKGLQTDIDSVRNVLADGAAAHNCIYRGKNLGTSVTAAQYAAISSGKFTDLYIGDYWVIKGVTYRIAAFDYYYNCGDTNFTKHHVVVVPDTSLYKAQMNTSNVTTGGYTGSAMYKSNLAQAKTTIKAAFGSAHVLTKRELLTNAVNGNTPSGWAWFDSDVELMNEVQVYGSVAWGAHDGNGYNVASGDGQFPLFMFDRTKLHNREDYWLRDVSSAPYFSFVAGGGGANGDSASYSRGVRPAFKIKNRKICTPLWGAVERN